MLVTSKELLLDAQKNGYAVGAFNTNDLEITHAILRAAEAKQAPILVQLSAGALRYAGVKFLPMIVARAANLASVPVAIHLDHGPDFETVMKALRNEFTSIMRDASKLPYDENVAEVRKVVEACHAIGIPVEAEIGKIGGAEEHVVVSEREATMSDPDECVEFVRDTECDFLAVAIGNAHGFYKGEPKLDFRPLRYDPREGAGAAGPPRRFGHPRSSDRQGGEGRYLQDQHRYRDPPRLRDHREEVPGREPGSDRSAQDPRPGHGCNAGRRRAQDRDLREREPRLIAV